MSRTATNNADAIREALISPNVFDSNGEPANLVDVIHRQARNIQAAGEWIGSGLDQVAAAIHDLADAIRGGRS
jgi:hypothetical protein